VIEVMTMSRHLSNIDEIQLFLQLFIVLFPFSKHNTVLG
jgi:hypothetical protein